MSREGTGDPDHPEARRNSQVSRGEDLLGSGRLDGAWTCVRDPKRFQLFLLTREIPDTEETGVWDKGVLTTVPLSVYTLISTCTDGRLGL